MELKELEKARKTKELKLIFVLVLAAILGFLLAIFLVKFDAGMAFIGTIFVILLIYSFFREKIIKNYEPQIKNAILEQIRVMLNLSKVPKMKIDVLKDEFTKVFGLNPDGKFGIYGIASGKRATSFDIYDLCYILDKKIIFYGLYIIAKPSSKDAIIVLKKRFDEVDYMIYEGNMYILINTNRDILSINIKTVLEENSKEIIELKDDLNSIILAFS